VSDGAPVRPDLAAHPTVRVAALGDLHCSRTSQGTLSAIFREAASRADILLLCGDLTDYGLPEEARILVKELAPASRLTVLAVLGNHDYESGQHQELRRILQEAGVHVLDGEPFETHGLGFAGVKGFGGGFGRRTLEPWGEEANKRFVQEAVQEAMKLGSALAKLRTPQRVALMHYAPVLDTVRGEPPEIFPFLGTSRLEEPLNRYSVAAVFHGHAHRGSLQGRTSAGRPVYNVALPLLRQAYPDAVPLLVLEIPVVPPADRREGERRGAAPAETPVLK
jgi:Icc-related predicted phosphoesterase